MSTRAGRPVRRRSPSSSSSTSPEREGDDDNDSFMLAANDSQSSLALSLTEAGRVADGAADEYQRRCREVPVYRLPAELLIGIFARLSSTRDLQSCMLVSREWARNSVGLLWYRPSMHAWAGVHSVLRTIRKVDKMFAYHDLVKRLNLSSLGPQASDAVLLAMRDCKRIERLTLTTCTKLSDQSIVPLIQGNRSLVALDVSAMEGFTDDSLMQVATHCVRLQGLNVTGCRRLTDESVMAVARNCRHLKRLKFNHCTLLTDKSIMTVAANSTNLLEIDLYDLPHVASASVTLLLESCRQLRELRLMKCLQMNDSAFTSLSSKGVSQSLRILDLTDCIEIGDKAIEKIVTACPKLRNLMLAKCRQLTDRAVFAITKLGKNLHYLHLGHCTRLTDDSIKQLSRQCTRIRYIDLACCTNLTDASITQLAANLPKLKRVGLVKCAGITDRSIHALATYGGRIPFPPVRNAPSVNVLERVHLSYCTQLTIEGVHVLLNTCPRLTHLSLTGVQAFLREDLTFFCREAPPEFNEHQRDVFCVFSGQGVEKLRNHLNRVEAFRTIPYATALTAVDGGTEMGVGFPVRNAPPPPPPLHLLRPGDLPGPVEMVEDEDLDDEADLDDEDMLPEVIVVENTTRLQRQRDELAAQRAREPWELADLVALAEMEVARPTQQQQQQHAAARALPRPAPRVRPLEHYIHQDRQRLMRGEVAPPTAIRPADAADATRRAAAVAGPAPPPTSRFSADAAAPAAPGGSIARRLMTLLGDRGRAEEGADAVAGRTEASPTDEREQVIFIDETGGVGGGEAPERRRRSSSVVYVGSRTA